MESRTLSFYLWQCRNRAAKHLYCCQGKSAIAAAGDFELMFTNTEVHKIVRISKTNQDNPNL